MKICALLVPREMKVEHSNELKEFTDEQLEEAIAMVRAMLDQKAGDLAKVIEGKTETVALPAPTGEQRRRKRPNRLLQHVDTAIGPSERKPRKVPSPPGA